MKKNTKLVCIDFDLTMTKIHIHNMMVNKKLPPKYKNNPILINGKKIKTEDPNDKAQYELKKLKTLLDDDFLRNSKNQKFFFNQLIKSEIKIAIVSHTAYPEVIDIALDELGLDKEKILVISGINKKNKNEHIKKALEYYKIDDIEKQNVLLIDDDINNLKAAKALGYSAQTLPFHLFPFLKLSYAIPTKPQDSLDNILENLEISNINDEINEDILLKGENNDDNTQEELN